MTMQENTAISFHDLKPETDHFRRDILEGLSKIQRSIPAKYFYDETGSLLFDRICELESYYPTRTEIGVLRQYAGEMAALIGPEAAVIEYGSGSSQKIPLLLDALEHPSAYIPLDICKEHLLASSERLARRYPHTDVIAICADYTKLHALPDISARRRIVFFPGSTIGNCTPMQAIRLLRNTAKLLGPGGQMLVGVDTKKEESILEAAYNDPQGVTAAFNLNLLTHINRELGSDFVVDNFSHHAFYNSSQGRIEMHLVSHLPQTVHIDEHVFHFEQNESIHTENSYKYSVPEFQKMAEASGFESQAVWMDADQLFSIHLLSAV